MHTAKSQTLSYILPARYERKTSRRCWNFTTRYKMRCDAIENRCSAVYRVIDVFVNKVHVSLCSPIYQYETEAGFVSHSVVGEFWLDTLSRCWLYRFCYYHFLAAIRRQYARKQHMMSPEYVNFVYWWGKWRIQILRICHFNCHFIHAIFVLSSKFRLDNFAENV